MIAKVTRGGDIAGLMRYLVGPGRANEHTHPHLVWGSDGVMARWSDDELGVVDARAVADFLDLPRTTYGVSMRSKSRSFDTSTGQYSKYAELRPAHVWHCSLSLPADHRPLEDHEWAAVAKDFVDGMGFSDVEGRASTRFVAVHHGVSAKGNDHIHLAVNLIREDGTKADVWQDYKRASGVVAEIEKRYGLEVVAGREVGRSAPAVSKQDHYELSDERKAAERQAKGLPMRHEPYSKTLARTVRACAVASETEAEFVRRLRREGLWVRPRFAAGTQEVVTGFAVAERPPRGEQPQWRGAGNLGRDLSLPRLRSTWVDSPTAASEAAAEWQAAWRGRPAVGSSERETIAPTSETWAQYTEEMRDLGRRLVDVDAGDHATWARLAHEASGTLAAWSLRLEQKPGALAKASDQLAAAASLHKRNVQPPAVRDMSMRGAARLVMMAAVGSDSAVAQALLLRQLVVTLVALHRAFEQTSQLRQTRALALALDVDLKQVHDTLAATSTSATASTGEPTQGTGIAAPEVQRPVPGQVAKTAETERSDGARTGTGRGRKPETGAER